MTNIWKIVAIIFIIISVLLSLLMVYSWHLGGEIMRNEAKCGGVICDGYDAYNYQANTGMCFCYIAGEVVYREQIK